MSSLSQTELQRKIHDKNINIEPDNYFGSLIAPYITRRFAHYIKPPLLDAGAGDGAFLRVLRRSFPKHLKNLHGIDLIPNPTLGIIKGSVDNLPYSDDSFQTVICSEVLEHLDEQTRSKALQEFQRVLLPNGYIVCTFPFDEDLAKQTFTCPHCDTPFHRYGHVKSWHSRKSIFKMFTDAGFTVHRLEILPLGAVAKFPWLRLFSPLLNRLNNPPGLRKRALVICRN